MVELGADVRARAHLDGRTALHEAADLGQVEATKLLLELGADAHARDFKGNTAAMLATDLLTQQLLKNNNTPNQRTVVPRCASSWLGLRSTGRHGNDTHMYAVLSPENIDLTARVFGCIRAWLAHVTM